MFLKPDIGSLHFLSMIFSSHDMENPVKLGLYADKISSFLSPIIAYFSPFLKRAGKTKPRPVPRTGP
jgi:hypothetical protein